MGIFTRDEEELLTYDADAFFYFAGTVLLVTLVPWTILLLRRIAWPRPPPEEDFDTREHAPKEAVVRQCATSDMQEKRARKREEAAAWRHRLRPWRLLQLHVIVAGWVCFYHCVTRLKPITFDPHTALGLMPGASQRDIKKAYRQMSLQHHPDKDRDNPLAPVIFQQITKAYRTLTDEKARANYEKYGNPDGPVGMKVGIALHPVILLGKDIQLKTLCIFFSILFGVPLSIVCCCLRGSHLSTGGVSAETLRTLHACMDSEVKAEDGPGFLAASAEVQRLGQLLDLRVLGKAMADLRPQPLESGAVVEVCGDGPFRGRRGVARQCPANGGPCEVELWPAMPIPGQQQPEMQTFARAALATIEPQIHCPFSDPPIRRYSALIWGHMWRLHQHMSPAVRARLDAVLLLSVRVLRAAVSIAAHGQPGSNLYDVVRGLIYFQRALIQGLELDASPLLQLPHVNKVPKEAPPLKEVVEAGGLAPALLKELGLGDAQRLDIEAFCRHAPRVELSVCVEVNDEEDIAEGDFASLTVKLTRLNLSSNEAIGPVHAPLFPGPKLEEWWILVYDERARRMVTADIVFGTGREETVKVHFMVPRPGKHRWTAHALCGCYTGLDASCPVNFDTKRRKEVNTEIFVHPDDAQIKTLFEELMEGLNPDENDEDSSDDEKEAAPKQPPQPVVAAEGGAAVAAPAKAADDDSDEDSEAEHEQEDGLFFKASCEGGIFIYAAPEEDQQKRLGSVPKGTVLRGVVDGAPEGWAQVAAAGGAWIRVSDAEPSADLLEDAPALNMGALEKQSLHTVVKTQPPLYMVRRWMKTSDTKLEVEDLRSVGNIDDSRVRMMIEEMIRDKIGDERFEELLDGAQAEAKKYRDRLGRALGFFSSPNGIVWHVSPQGTVHGLYANGSRLRDFVELTPDDKLQIGPFRLDETRTCSCIHWHRIDDPAKSWVWARDASLQTRVRLGQAF